MAILFLYRGGARARRRRVVRRRGPPRRRASGRAAARALAPDRVSTPPAAAARRQARPSADARGVDARGDASKGPRAPRAAAARPRRAGRGGGVPICPCGPRPLCYPGRVFHSTARVVPRDANRRLEAAPRGWAAAVMLSRRHLPPPDPGERSASPFDVARQASTPSQWTAWRRLITGPWCDDGVGCRAVVRETAALGTGAGMACSS